MFLSSFALELGWDSGCLAAGGGLEDDVVTSVDALQWGASSGPLWRGGPPGGSYR